MCPDRQLLSMHVDGEIPSPWREKLESHLESCPDCAARAEAYRNLSAGLRTAAAVSDSAAEEARARVWRNIAAKAAPVRRISSWRRPVVIPIPAAIAAVLAVAILAAGGAGIALNPGAKAVPSIAIRQGESPVIPVSDMGSVLHYLESQESGGNIVIINLPENSNFSLGGEPTIVRAADYTGRVAP